MGTTPTTSNEALVIVDAVISALMQGGEVAAEAYLTSLDPALLAVPIVAWLMDEGVKYLGSIISVVEQKFVNGIVIDIQVNGEKSAVITQAVALQIALSAGDPNAIKAQADKAAAAWGSIIHYDGSSAPAK